MTIPHPSLVGAYAKLERGLYHARHFSEIINDFASRKPAKITIEWYPGLDHRRIEVVQTLEMPSDAALVAGDAIHNMRAALDVAIYAIVGDKTEQPWRVAFPISNSSETWEADASRAQLDVAPPLVRAVVKSMEPWPKSKTVLHLLHRLDIEDKHRLNLKLAADVGLGDREIADLLGRELVPGLFFRLEVGVGIINGMDDSFTDAAKAHWYSKQVAGVRDAPYVMSYSVAFGSEDRIDARELLDGFAGEVRQMLDMLSVALSEPGEA